MSHPSQSASSLAPIVYIVDDDNGMRTSLAWLLESVGVKSAGFANANEFLGAFDPSVPACLVLDVRMPEQSGFDVQAELNRQGATLPIIFVSGHGDIPMSVRALQNGAIDFVEKPYNSQQMLDRVQRALKLATQRHAANQKQRDLRKRLESLTAREKEVLRGVIDGKGSKRIAPDLSISVKTVDVHRASIKDKLGAASIAMLVRDVMAVWDQDASANGVLR
jgi:FixJ family two-component response regulator